MNPYSTLGVTKDATKSEIAKAYRKLALKYHPDRNPDNKEAENRFKEIANAYDILSNEEKRRRYDLGQSMGGNYTQGGYGMHNVDLSSVFSSFGGLGSIFQQMGDFFGQSNGATQHSPHLRRSLALTPQEAYQGVTKKITLNYSAICKACQGNGAKNGTALTQCPTCKGQGQQTYVHPQLNLHISRTCTHCQGEGTFVRIPCSDCQGQGMQPATKKLVITIPPHTPFGETLTVVGHGQETPHGKGNLYLKIIPKV